MYLKSLEAIKYKVIRFIESNYKINLLIYNNIQFFKFFLPHEKDFYGMMLLCENSKNKVILDIGASLGISSMGFRKLGFKNRIYAFEPNYYLYKKYLKKNLFRYKNISLKNIALGNHNSKKTMYSPFYNSEFIHYFSTPGLGMISSGPPINQPSDIFIETKFINTYTPGQPRRLPPRYTKLKASNVSKNLNY